MHVLGLEQQTPPTLPPSRQAEIARGSGRICKSQLFCGAQQCTGWRAVWLSQSEHWPLSLSHCTTPACSHQPGGEMLLFFFQTINRIFFAFTSQQVWKISFFNLDNFSLHLIFPNWDGLQHYLFKSCLTKILETQ